MILLTFAPRTLSRKIIMVIIMTTLAATLTLIPAIFFTLRQGMQGQRQRHLAGVRQLVERLIEENRRTVHNYSVLFATDRQVKDNLYYYAELAGEREHPAAAVHHLVDAFGLTHIELGDRFGKVVVDAAMPDRQDMDLADDPLVGQALTGATVSGIEPYRNGFLLKGVAPIFHDEGQLIGTIGTGVALDNAFAAMIRELSGAEIAIVDRNSHVIAASMPRLVKEKDLTLFSETMTLYDKKYQVMTLPFIDVRQRPLGQVVILAADTLPAILSRTTLTVVAILMIIALVSIVTTALILRRVLAPIGELRDGAEKIGCGKFDHRLSSSADDEIGGLARAFNAMAGNLQQMRDVQKKLQHAERLASIGEFTAATAHELNNPIANIIGLAKIIRKDLGDDNPLAEDLDLLVKETSRCGSIVRDLLVYSRASQPNREPVNLNRLMDDAIVSIRQRYLPGKNIRIHFARLPSSTLPSFVDPVQIEQVFRNLLINAAQAISRQGEIEIAIKENPEGFLLISVADSGCGILPEHLDKVFYPFFTTKKTGEGTGLGLAVCYTIVQSHGGSITVAGRKHGGSVFTITLPKE
ncbi:MAG: ATP-binding protein [Desulfobulbaceae bacterium]|nr:ATP-binding protein [Desulfobulbaceae bacterium]